MTFTLAGFQTIVRENLIVEVGRNVDLTMAMKVAPGHGDGDCGGADSPFSTRSRRARPPTSRLLELTKIPTSRDPFALMRSVAGVLVDRVNVGGNETGQQSNFTMKGTRPQDAVWTLDGIIVTDMTLTGASPTYFNFDNFQEIQVSTSGQDITQPTGGLGMNFVVKRGTNDFHAAFRGYFGNDSLQASNVPGELAALGVDRRHRRSRQADLGLRLRIWRTDRLASRVVLRIVLEPGHPACLSHHARRRRSHRAEQPEPQTELAGDEEGSVQLPLLRRLQDEGQPQPGHDRHHQQRANGDCCTRATPTPAAGRTDSGSSPTITSSARTCSCRGSTRTTTLASFSRPRAA